MQLVDLMAALSPCRSLELTSAIEKIKPVARTLLLYHSEKILSQTGSKMIKNDEEFVSKTVKKKMMTELQKIGEMLVTLKATRLNEIPLDGSLRLAITQAQKMKTGNALRRQLQYIGKLMRSTNYDEIIQALARFEEAGKRQNYLSHQTENWRDRFIQQGQQALNEFLEQYPESNRQQLRQLLREVAKEQQQLAINPQLAPKYSRKLFKMLRDVITASHS